MNIRNIVEKWLIDNGYEGLAGNECGCEVGDLMPCEYPSFADCEPGYKVPCPGPEGCWADGDCPWHISPTKPKGS